MKEGWEIKKIKDICDKASSNIVQNKITDIDGDYPVYGASGYVQNVNFFHREKPYIGIVKDGAGVGRVNMYPAYSSLLGTLQYILPKNGYLLEYVAYALKSLNLASFASGATIPHIYFKNYGESEIPVAPIAEQEKIVAELDCLSGIIEKKRQQLKELDALAQSIFYEMFGDPVENEKGWEVKKLGEVGVLARGVSKHRPRNAPELLGGNVPLIQTGDIANSDMYIKSYKSTYSELGLSQSKLWPSGTLCITIAATIGKCSILTFDSCFPDSVVGYIVNAEYVNNEYIYYIFGCLQKILEDNAPAVAQKNINLQVLNELTIPLPPLLLQQTFASKIEAIEKQKDLIKQSIAEVETLFNARMQEYFG